MADDPSANREAELLALRIVETLEAAGALDVRNRNPNRAGMGNREGSFRKSSPGSINDFGSNSPEEG